MRKSTRRPQSSKRVRMERRIATVTGQADFIVRNA